MIGPWSWPWRQNTGGPVTGLQAEANVRWTISVKDMTRLEACYIGHPTGKCIFLKENRELSFWSPKLREFFLEGMETPKPETDTRDLIHANFSAFQEEIPGCKKIVMARPNTGTPKRRKRELHTISWFQEHPSWSCSAEDSNLCTGSTQTSSCACGYWLPGKWQDHFGEAAEWLRSWGRHGCFLRYVIQNDRLIPMRSHEYQRVAISYQTKSQQAEP